MAHACVACHVLPSSQHLHHKASHAGLQAQVRRRAPELHAWQQTLQGRAPASAGASARHPSCHARRASRGIHGCAPLRAARAPWAGEACPNHQHEAALASLWASFQRDPAAAPPSPCRQQIPGCIAPERPTRLSKSNCATPKTRTLMSCTHVPLPRPPPPARGGTCQQCLIQATHLIIVLRAGRHWTRPRHAAGSRAPPRQWTMMQTCCCTWQPHPQDSCPPRSPRYGSFPAAGIHPGCWLSPQ